MHNMYEAYYRVYAAMNIRDIDGLLRAQSNNLPKDPATENADVLENMELKAFAGQQHDAHIAAHIMMGLSALMQANPIGGVMLYKHIMQHIRLKAEEDTEAELYVEYGSDPDHMVSDLQREGMISLKIAQFMQEMRALQDKLANPGGGGQDPIVALKAQELQQRAAKDQADIQLKEQGLQLDQSKIAQNEKANQERIASQQKVAQMRTGVALQRINQPRKGG
jgi:hypothetical protein